MGQIFHELNLPSLLLLFRFFLHNHQQHTCKNKKNPDIKNAMTGKYDLSYWSKFTPIGLVVLIVKFG